MGYKGGAAARDRAPSKLLVSGQLKLRDSLNYRTGSTWTLTSKKNVFEMRCRIELNNIIATLFPVHSTGKMELASRRSIARKLEMRKFLFHRIGVADDQSDNRPTLHDCIDLVLTQSDTLIDDVIEGLSVAAMNSKEKGGFGGQTPLSSTVTDLLSSQSAAIKKTFTSQLRQCVYQSEPQAVEERPLLRFEDLQLLDPREIDANIELALAHQEVARCVDDILPPLNSLISTMLGWITVQPHLNPLKPETFVRALQACLVQYAPDDQARATLIIPAAGLLGVGLRQLYRELCDWMRSQGIEPALPVGRSPRDASLVKGDGADSSVARTLVTFDKLRALLSGELDRQSREPGMRDFLHTVPASMVALEDLKLVEPMMKRLAQRANQPSKAGPKPAPPSELAEREPTPGRQMGRQLGQEVVRLMLEHLTRDQRLLPPVRQLIKSLEPALLALGSSDPRFFSDRQHSARQFLDKLTHRSLAFADEGEAGFKPFFNSISDAVNRLIAGDGQSAEFSQVLSDLETGWASDEVALRSQHEEAARVLLHAEQRNLLAQNLADDFEARLKGKDVSKLIAEFLSGPWAQVVAESQLGCADGRADPDGYLALVDDLMWSVQLDLARRNRNRLVQMVPKLLVKIRQGLQLIQYPPERMAEFFDGLISVHEQVFDVVEPAVLGAPKDQAELPNEKYESDTGGSGPGTGDSGYFWVADNEARDSCYLEPEEEHKPSEGKNPWTVAGLNTGVWVELIVDGAWRRAQLTWTSPHRTLFMFISQGGQAHSMSQRTMERLRMQGSIKVVSDGHLVENALDEVAMCALQNDRGQAKQKP